MKVTKDKSGMVREEELGDFVFVPMLSGKSSA
jgi:hypothetical protein